MLKPLDLLGRALGGKAKPTKELNNSIRFNMDTFDGKWRGKTVRYEGVIAKVNSGARSVEFKQLGAHPRTVSVEVSLSLLSEESLRQLKSNTKIHVVGEIGTLFAPAMMTLGVNRLTLLNGRISE